ncbi:hypothetical protein SAMN05428967_0962 [Phyllobacterium sp. YR620]|uniref:hypothetical protein n=1 Tax=Phyllobacterium sp. YR620 TaxID=1881066 RepID=UPI0008860BBD|nr:hypothetical protein [Phyllobacterium sp. YR620]SDP03571.1 hypothetical protein SAMN05428967_0962 [Phyllobacterium sp. YR620]
MDGISPDLIYEILRKMQGDIASWKENGREQRQDSISVRSHLHLLEGEMNNLRASMSSLHDRLDRIENRLELRELAEAQARFEPHP